MHEVMTDPIRLMIVDDHDLLREGIKARLADVSGFSIVAEGANGQEAVDLFDLHKPDIALLDVSMPVKNGLEAAKEIIANDPAAKIMFLSVFDDAQYVQEAVRIGAKGYVLKDVSKPQMTLAIETVAKGGVYLGSQVEEQLAKQNPCENDHGLTLREKQVLGKIAQGLANKQVAYELGISVRTVESHRSAIRDKTGGGNAAALAKIAVDLGL